MDFVKCKNDSEKVAAIAEFCKKQIELCNYSINLFESDRDSAMDYFEEISDLENLKSRFEWIMRVINADEFTSILKW